MTDFTIRMEIGWYTADTPEAALAEFLDQARNYGIDGLTFEVTNEDTRETYTVKGPLT